MMDHRDLEYFLAVASHGTVSAAAASVFVSQPAVSRRIAGLERDIGVQLFRRTASGMRLTPAGERLQELAQDLRNRMARADDVMQAIHNGHQNFTVACPETTGNYFIAPFVAEGAPIDDIQPAAPSKVYALLDTGADFAVNTLAPPLHLASRQLATTPVFFHFRPEDRIMRSREVELSTAARSPMLLPGQGSAIELTVRETARAANIDLGLARTASTGTMAQAMAAAGQGNAITIEPAHFGLSSALLTHRGKQLTVSLYAAWEADHYASAELDRLAVKLSRWIQGSLPRLTGKGDSTA